METAFSADGSAIRKSRRILGVEPEYTALEYPEQTPKKTPFLKSDEDLQTDKVKKSSPYSPKKNHKKPTRATELHCLSNSSIDDRATADVVASRMSIIASRKYSGNAATDLSIRREHVPANCFPPHPRGQSLPFHSSILLILVLCVALTYYMLSSDANNVQKVESLHKLFPEQSKDLWGFVSHGMNSSEPFVLLLVHSDQESVASCLAKHIAETVVHSRTGGSGDILIIKDMSELSRETFLERLHLEKKLALVLLHLESFPADAADFLHYVLDVHEPWVPSGVYVLTLNIPNIDASKGKVFSNVENFLKQKWSGLKEDDLNALISRVCNFEYLVKRDKNPCA